jgi:hypothetical protein
MYSTVQDQSSTAVFRPQTDDVPRTHDAAASPASAEGLRSAEHAAATRVPRLTLKRIALDKKISPYFST